MSSKNRFDRPPTSAAPIHIQPVGTVGVDLSLSTAAIDALPVIQDNLSRGVRRQLGARQRATATDTNANEVATAGPQAYLSTSDRIIRLPELLAILQISRSTAYAWQHAGRLPHSVALGPRTVGWKLSDVERFLASLGTMEERNV